MVLEKTLESPLDSKEIKSINQILRKINPEYSLEGLMLKLQHSGHLMQIADSLEKTLMLGKIEGRRKRGWRGEMVGWHHQFNGHELGQTPGDGEEQGGLASAAHGTMSSNIIETKTIKGKLLTEQIQHFKKR